MNRRTADDQSTWCRFKLDKAIVYGLPLLILFEILMIFDGDSIIGYTTTAPSSTVLAQATQPLPQPHSAPRQLPTCSVTKSFSSYLPASAVPYDWLIDDELIIITTKGTQMGASFYPKMLYVFDIGPDRVLGTTDDAAPFLVDRSHLNGISGGITDVSIWDNVIQWVEWSETVPGSLTYDTQLWFCNYARTNGCVPQLLYDNNPFYTLFYNTEHVMISGPDRAVWVIQDASGLNAEIVECSYATVGSQGCLTPKVLYRLPPTSQLRLLQATDTRTYMLLEDNLGNGNVTESLYVHDGSQLLLALSVELIASERTSVFRAVRYTQSVDILYTQTEASADVYYAPYSGGGLPMNWPKLSLLVKAPEEAVIPQAAFDRSPFAFAYVYPSRVHREFRALLLPLASPDSPLWWSLGSVYRSGVYDVSYGNHGNVVYGSTPTGAQIQVVYQKCQ